MGMNSPKNSTQPAAKKPPSYLAAVSLWAVTVGLFCIAPIWKAPPEKLEVGAATFVVALFMVLAGFIGFATTAIRRNEFPRIQIIARFAAGVLIGLVIVSLAPMVLGAGAWLFAQPVTVHDINDVPPRWFAASAMFFGGGAVVGYFQKPAEISSYADAIAAGAIGGTSAIVAMMLLMLPLTTIPTIAQAVQAALLAAVAGGIPCAYEGLSRIANNRREFPVLRMVNSAIKGLIVGAIAGFIAIVIWGSLSGMPITHAPTWMFLLVSSAIIGTVVNVRRTFRMEHRPSIVRGISDAITLSIGLANRGYSLVMGLIGVGTGLIIILVAQAVFKSNDETYLRYAAFGVGLYFIIARGLGPVWSALSWSQLSTDTHGKARTATVQELTESGLMPRSADAIYLGQVLESGRPRGEIGYLGASPVITIGKTGSGKGTGLIIPNLSTLRRSILIIDPKGEAAAVTARKRSAFGRVVVLNPFNYLADQMPWLASEGYNPLATIKTEKHFVSDCTVVGHALVKQEKDGAGRFFSSSAHDLVTALIMYEVISKKKRGERPSLADVWTMISAPWGGSETGPTGVARIIGEMATHEYAPLRSLTGRFMSTLKSNQDIISTAINEISFLNDPEVGDDISSTSDFRFADMKEEIVSVYLILPATHMESHANWLRVMIASALRDLQATPPGQGLPPVLFMLDEFANLGHLPAISNAMNMTRGYGVQLWPFVQDLNQLKYLYHDNWENFLGARSALTAFAPGDVFTSNYLAELCGNKTMIVETENEKADQSGMGRGRGPQGLPLIRPEEIRAMAPEQMLCFVDPVKRPFMAVAPGYWKTQFKEGLDNNPYHPG
jgi:type IV secretion system protein VirD4